MLVKVYKLPVMRWISSGDLMYNMVIIVNSTVLNTWKLLKKSLCLGEWEKQVKHCIEAAEDLLYGRTKALIDYENSNKTLDKARLKSKDVRLAEAHQQECCQKFEQLSESAKGELINFKRKIVTAFRRNLIEMSELEIKHARNNVSPSYRAASTCSRTSEPRTECEESQHHLHSDHYHRRFITFDFSLKLCE